MRRVSLGVVSAGLVAASLQAVPASAAPVECAPGSIWDPQEGKCIIIVKSPVDPGGGGTQPVEPVEPVDPGGDGPAPPTDPVCTESVSNQEVPCALGEGWRWVAGWNAYARLADPQPPISDPVWEGNTQGAIYDRAVWSGDRFVLLGRYSNPVWSLTPPWEELPDPQVLAREAITTMNLRAVTIGIVPEDTPGSVGLLGYPAWMWVDSPAENTMGPITRSASAGGYTVTATGRVDQVVWDMGDGSSVTCTGPGTEYEDSYLDSDSPDCGYRYQQSGHYDVSATSSWVIDWSGMGQTGTVGMQLRQDTTLTIGEVQVLNQVPSP